jgi:hypothetical protein
LVYAAKGAGHTASAPVPLLGDYAWRLRVLGDGAERPIDFAGVQARAIVSSSRRSAFDHSRRTIRFLAAMSWISSVRWVPRAD